MSRSRFRSIKHSTIVLAVALASLLAGCGSSDKPSQASQTNPTTAGKSTQTSSSTAASPAAVRPKAKKHHRAPPKPKPAAAGLPSDYFGLGATVAQWKAQNTHFPPGRIPLGLFSYTIDRVVNGRVVAATLEVNTKPKFGAFDLARNFAFPDDKNPLNSQASCRLWRSKILDEVLGLPYIISVADTSTQTARAELQASKPSCS
jgi:outer membrane murein-binding lipoprotein Lpp